METSPCAKWWQVYLVTVIVNTTFMVVIPPLLVNSAHSMVQPQTMQFSSCPSGWQSGHCWQEQEQSAQATWQVVIQQELAGDVESNPGPGPIRVTRSNLPGDDRLNEGKALIIHQAPAGIRLVLSLWEPGKSDIRQCMEKQFLVQQEYCVKKDDPVPSLACHGCAQGFHQECLETLLGGTKEFPDLPGVVYWLSPLCSPTYSPLLTTATPEPGRIPGTGRSL